MLLHVNVRLLHKNYELLYELIKALQILPHVICITETRIKNQSLSNLDISNYSFVHANTTTNAGGVAMYISDNFKLKVCENLYQLCNSETLWVNIIDQTDSSYIIRVIYRHPSQVLINAFIEDPSNYLTDLNRYNINYFILEDLNINTSAINRLPDAMPFTNTLISCGTFPIITKPARVTDLTATTIDHIITNITTHKILPGVIKLSEVSDYYPVLCQAQFNAL